LADFALALAVPSNGNPGYLSSHPDFHNLNEVDRPHSRRSKFLLFLPFSKVLANTLLI
jgi:hypothetical protein